MLEAHDASSHFENFSNHKEKDSQTADIYLGKGENGLLPLTTFSVYQAGTYFRATPP